MHHGGDAISRVAGECERTAAFFDEEAATRHGTCPSLSRAGIENEQATVGDCAAGQTAYL